MNRAWIKGVLVVLIAVFMQGETYGQSKEELEEERKKTQKEIEYTHNILKETKKSRATTLNKVRILNKRIELRKDLIESMNKEISLIESEIREKTEFIENLNEDMDHVKKEYETLIRYAYKNRNEQARLMFVLSAENFNQAYKRMKYIQHFTRYRKEQAMMIGELSDEIKKEVNALEKSRVQKEALVLEKSNENHNLQKEIKNNEQVISELSNKEKELMEEIKRKNRVADRLEKAIAEIISAEAKRSRTERMYDMLTPEEKMISDNFMENKGKLPWPTERGIITGRYGKHQHPVLKQITTQNDGIDISTVEGAEARALFDGVVSMVGAILGTNYTVIIRHGNFLTVYQNLVDVRVRKGDRVQVKQVLGRVHTERETGNTILHIEIWEEMNKQNPEEWLSRSN